MDERAVIEIKSPITGEVIGTVPAMSKEQVDDVVTRAKGALKEWSQVPLYERADLLYKAADVLLSKTDELARLLMLEVAKDEKSAKSEVTRTVDFIRFTADIAKSMHGESIQSDRFPGFENNKISLVTREPIGVVLAISPFNYPVNLAASKIAPALVGGNTVVFKPATQGALSGQFLAEVFYEAGCSKDALTVVTGKGSVIGDYVVTHKDINFINFLEVQT